MVVCIKLMQHTNVLVDNYNANAIVDGTPVNLGMHKFVYLFNTIVVYL